MDNLHVNTTTLAMGDKTISTPIEIFINQSGDNISIECKGSDGQQVSDAVIMTLSKLQKHRKDNGLAELAAALSCITVMFLGAVWFITIPKTPDNIRPVQVGILPK